MHGLGGVHWEGGMRALLSVRAHRHMCTPGAREGGIRQQVCACVCTRSPAYARWHVSVHAPVVVISVCVCLGVSLQMHGCACTVLHVCVRSHAH